MRPNATRVAGQAVIEGVLMRTDEAYAVAVRRPTGEVVVRRRKLPPRATRPWLGQRPLLRGLIAFFDATFLGALGLWFSLLQAGSDGSLATADVGAERVARRHRTGAGAAFWTLALGAIVAPLALVLLPSALDAWCAPGWARLAEAGSPRLARAAAQAVASVFQLVVLPLTLATLATLPPLRRLRGYHAAEHKVRAAFAAGVRLQLLHVRRVPVDLSDCTMRVAWSFAGVTTVLFAALEVLAPALPPPVDVGATGQLLLCSASMWLRLGLCLPALAITYELRRFRRGRARPALHVPPDASPTLDEPDAAMLEVALVALQAVLGGEAAQADGTDASFGWRRLGSALPHGTPTARLGRWRRRSWTRDPSRVEASCCTN